MPTNNFDDYLDKLKKVKLDPSRKNIKPRPPGLTEEQYLYLAIQEGHELLAAEAKTKPSVTPPQSVKPSPALEDALAKMSDNPYIRARADILNRMGPKARSVIEEMEKGTLKKDERYDKFCQAVTVLGDKLSAKN